MYTIHVNESKGYNVTISSNVLLKQLDLCLNGKLPVYFVDNKTCFKPKGIVKYIEVSEDVKSLEMYYILLSFLKDNNIKRTNTVFVAVGGGVLLDLIGFLASTYMRGVEVIYVPTTLLSMVDVSIGSKNGINVNKIKNSIGTFYSPSSVIIDADFLKTLDKRNYNSGYGEIIKYGCISDESLLDDILKPHDIKDVIYRSLIIKKRFVESDPLDKGVRKALNFGHSYGHALESYYNFSKYLHGEAISIGMNMMYDSRKLKRVCRHFQLPIKDDVKLELLDEFLIHDKKNSYVYLKKLGEVDV